MCDRQTKLKSNKRKTIDDTKEYHRMMERKKRREKNKYEILFSIIYLFINQNLKKKHTLC